MKKKPQHSSKNVFALLSFLSFVLAFGLRYQAVVKNSFSSLVLVFSLFLVGVLLLQRYKKTLPIPELSGMVLVYISLFVDKSAYLSNVVAGIVQPLIFAILGFLFIRIYDIKLEFEFKNYKKMAIIFGVSLLFAYVFLVMNEPFPTFIQNSFLILIIYTFFVSLGEELVFRATSYSLVKKLFSGETAVHVQAAIFTFIHMLSITALYHFYQFVGGSLALKDPTVNVIVYAVALYGFAVIAARYAKGEKDTNIMYPIFFHWLVNFLNLAMLML